MPTLPPARARIVAVEPATDRRVRFAAIDEVDAYHAAATADLSAPFPDLSPRPPRVLDIAIAEALVRVGAGFAVEIEAALTVAGDWRGGVVRAATDGGPLRTVARLVDGETGGRLAGARRPARSPSPSHPAPRPRPPALRSPSPTRSPAPSRPPARPPTSSSTCSATAPAGCAGPRPSTWTSPASSSATVPQGGVPLTWEQMTPLHRGHLTASPLETVEPPPGEWIFAARADRYRRQAVA